MSVQPAEESDSLSKKQSPSKIIKKFRKGDLVRVEREKYFNSLEAKASDDDLPEYIFLGPGEVLIIKDDYCQIRWRRPVPDVWFRTEHLVSY
tara:strand:- start:136 stop:411 length:276 start_codon:yes stop_codon:yes gene_type:complete